MKNRLFFSFEDRQYIERAIRDGKTYKDMADVLPFSESGIKQEVLRNGNKKGYSATEAQRRRDKALENRKEKLSTVFSETQKAQIKEMVEKGYSLYALRTCLGCSWYKLNNFLKENDLHIKRKETCSLGERISAIEGQLDYIFEELRMLKGNK